LIKLIIALFILSFLPACSTAQKPAADPIDVYKQGMEEGSKAIVEEVQKNLRQKNAYGSVEPYNPVRLPPDIHKVWIVDHQNDAGDLIQGHWVFMVLTPGRWASPSVPSIHPQSGERKSSAVPVIEDKPAASPSAAQSKVNASQGQ
jgi:hypothetical protein